MKTRQAALALRESETELWPKLRDLASASLITTDDLWLLAPLADSAPTLAQAFDETGIEAAANKVHIEDYADREGYSLDEVVFQGIAYVQELARKLAQFGEPFRICLSVDVDAGAVTARFYRRRPDQEWCSDDPEEYELDEVLYLDV